MREPDWYTARELARVEPLPPRTFAVASADGLTLAEDARARGDLPGFDTSAMDGWAVSGPGPWTVVGEVLAGHAPQLDLVHGQACVIATGAAVPAGTTGIVRREVGTLDGNRLAGTSVPGEDIRPAGEECAAGDVLVAAGSVLSPAAIGLLCAAGLDEVVAHPQPRACVVLFGDELVESGVAGVGQVRDALGPQVPGWLRRMGVVTVGQRRAADTLDAHVEQIRLAASEADVVITTGGTAAGPVDHLHTAVAELGGTFIVDSVAVRPGHPMALAQLPDARLLALPGNPQSAIVALLTLGSPLFDSLSGRVPSPLPEVTMGEAAKAPVGEHRLLAAGLVAGVVHPVAHLGSAMLRGLAAADGFAVLPPGGSAAGDHVAWLGLP
ncbi:MAG: molybdopterin molybdotransferase MoeA [Candidatus Nanopelagicales bacterium]|jgi:molybdopterin molybdotransferase|nr:molybdopterin molybdotransferase MoeA [Candidatus Nanopelagicales bacterium]